MTQSIEALTTATLSLALDAASLRHQAIASNIANVNTEGYVPQHLNFSAQMDMLQNSSQGNSNDSFGLLASKLELQPMLDKDGLPAKVQLDVEMAEMAHNAVQYQTLIKMLGKHYSIMSSAVNDGKK